jgi:ABC-type nitrate/sulfonate/bicarbonate transport system substrate-binding protein
MMAMLMWDRGRAMIADSHPPLKGEGRTAEGSPGWGGGRAVCDPLPNPSPRAGEGREEAAARLSPPPGPLARADLPPPGGGDHGRRRPSHPSHCNGMPGTRLPFSFTALIAALLLLASPSLALDTVRLGKAVPNSFAFGAAEVGIDAKIFAGEGLDVAVSSFRGDAQLQQALAAGSVDVGLGSGPGLGFRVKGAPMIGVAAMYGAPRNLALLVSAKSPIRSVADLKGKRIGVTTAGSLTEWLVRELSRQQGWGSDGIVAAALGQMQARLAAMDRGELDGVVLEAANGYDLEEAGRTRNLILFGDIVKHFYTHVIFATDEMVDKRPELLRRFLRGWFKTIAFMKANRDFAVKSEQRTLDVRQSVVEKIYDAQMEGFSLDGAWDPEAIDVIRSSLKELGVLPAIPDAKALYTDRFVPVRF